MDKIVNLESLFHRSKERIKDLGEVFTPDKYVDDMLELLAKNNKNFWSSEDIAFFEPCCGHGNIVLAIYRKRLQAFYKASFGQYSKEAAFYAVANSLNTLWAIDIDQENVESCRTRVLYATLEFISEKLNYSDFIVMLKDHDDYFAHILSAIEWHIFENETLSTLSSVENLEENTSKLATSNEWIAKYEHHKMEFDITWASFFEQCEKEQSIPLDYQRAMKFINSLGQGKPNLKLGFAFADFLLPKKDSNKVEPLGA